ncbi:DUF4219 domain-containing protein/UBN2 domain-containing protein [Senna tora]|uniref:DUF4219 domain-containing protein/UBN2 domain-containing protein n=1 Tax=Senna tora TaxID=362788 RepID=A0A834X6G6_9FABA|nr:DUF4219 domain-containing protein/UBN2 domain-containing protein [Senna tora]
MASTTPNYTQTLIPIFDGEGYEFWSIKMKTIFISQDLWGAIEEAFQEATPEEQSTWAAGRLKEYKQTMQKDAKALSLIQQGEGESIQAFFSRVSNIVNQIRSNGDTIEDKKIVQKILRSLPAKFDHVVAAIEEAKDLTKLTLVELEGSLRAHEERMQKWIQHLETKENTRDDPSPSTSQPRGPNVSPDSSPPRKERSLQDIYQTCDVAFFSCTQTPPYILLLQVRCNGSCIRRAFSDSHMPLCRGCPILCHFCP